MSDLAIDNAINIRSAKVKAALPVFSLTLFLSAFLLFSVQPYFSKLVLPQLGGSPGVWSVAIVFFQTVLLLGYGYAHLLTRFMVLRTALLIHLVVHLAAFLVLPVALPTTLGTMPETGQAYWLLLVFAVAVGLPFFAVSANGPLLQAWFAKTGHPQADDPYFLYGASNIGSFASLFLYIILFEPVFKLSEQSTLWTIGYTILGVLILTCGWLAVQTLKTKSVANYSSYQSNISKMSFKQVAKWVGLAFVPSALLVAVTAHITTDVAAVPFLWVIPLALFLLTFVLLFRTSPLISTKYLVPVLPWLALPVLATTFVSLGWPIWLTTTLHIVFFFLAALLFHAILYDNRPKAENLTSFYLFMSLGGVLGGAFSTLLSPLLFNWLAEYPSLIGITLMCRPDLLSKNRQESVKLWTFAAIIAVTYWVFSAENFAPAFSNFTFNLFLLFLFLVAGAAAQMFQPRLLVACLIMAAPAAFAVKQQSDTLVQVRTFFGLIKVDNSVDESYRRMVHGNTIHGIQAVTDYSPGIKPEPLTYYHHTGAMAQALEAVRQNKGGKISNAGIVGLGTGSFLCHAKPGEAWTAFEIDRAVVDMARNPELFTFISACTPDAPMIVGDARLTLAGQRDGKFDYLMIDAFSSNSIPVHLMTTQAVELYFNKISDGGLLVLHISNRNLNLKTILAAIADELELELITGISRAPEGHPHAKAIKISEVAVLARNKQDFGALNKSKAWKAVEPDGIKPWTDDYSNLLAAFLSKR